MKEKVPLKEKHFLKINICIARFPEPLGDEWKILSE